MHIPVITYFVKKATSGFFLRIKTFVFGLVEGVTSIFKMKKKWPFQMPEEYLDMKISDLREIHGIKVLSSEELNYFPTQWSGSINK